ncbi:MAG TPA: Smr/MutS family protein [Bacilli bacterium]|mgnify:CR=1 FL=1|nr:Smr/MutS family protein [Bacilli bacterium]
MNKTFKDPFLYQVPTIDVHGETATSVVFIINDFINDNYKLEQSKVLIIHGKGTGILKSAIHQVLKTNQQVAKYAIYNLNEGCTLVELNKVCK